MYYCLGLGNVGGKYKNTRHNVAWIILEQLFGDDWNVNKYMNAEMYPYMIDGEELLFIKPHTFMNNSGEVIAYIKKDDLQFSPQQLILLYDDIDLPFGHIKISFDRGDGGHNGVKSIIEHLGSRECIRVRIGISELLEGGRLIKPNVLGRFSEQQLDHIKNIITPQIEKIIHVMVKDGYKEAMNKYNKK